MNTKSLVAALGSTALLANLLLPSIAFGQLTQQGEVTVDCPTLTGSEVTFKRAPADVVFDGVTAGVNTDSVDSSVTSAADLAGGNDAASVDLNIDGDSIANDHLLRVQDLSSYGIDNCGAAGWAVSAAVTSDITDTTSASLKGLANVTTGQSGLYHAIHAEDLYLVTSEDVGLSNISDPEAPILADWDNPNAAPRGTAPVFYARHNLSNVGNPDNLFDSATNPVKTTSTAWETASTYSTDGEALDTSTTIMATPCQSKQGHYADIYMGVALGLVGAIDTLQASGTYQGTVTYTYAPLAC